MRMCVSFQILGEGFDEDFVPPIWNSTPHESPWAWVSISVWEGLGTSRCMID